MKFTELDATFNVAQEYSTAGVGFPDWNQVQQHINVHSQFFSNVNFHSMLKIIVSSPKKY